MKLGESQDEGQKGERVSGEEERRGQGQRKKVERRKKVKIKAYLWSGFWFQHKGIDWMPLHKPLVSQTMKRHWLEHADQRQTETHAMDHASRSKGTCPNAFVSRIKRREITKFERKGAWTTPLHPILEQENQIFLKLPVQGRQWGAFVLGIVLQAQVSHPIGQAEDIGSRTTGPMGATIDRRGSK